MGLEVLIPIFGILIVLVPVFGLTTILTLRLGGKPFVESLARELRGSGMGGSTDLHLELRELTEQVESLTLEVHELRAAREFDAKLLESRDRASEERDPALR